MRGHEVIRDGERMVDGGEAARAQDRCSYNFDSVLFVPFPRKREVGRRERRETGETDDVGGSARKAKEKGKELEGEGKGSRSAAGSYIHLSRYSLSIRGMK